jgi:SOS-response transcriptional repressors (recA-mediated autopeptidases)
MTTGERMKLRRKEIGLSAETVAQKLGLSPATIYRYERGDIEKIPGDILAPLAKALQTTEAWLMGWANSSDPVLQGSIIPMPTMKKIPLVGTIACGEPILAVENIDGEVDIPEHIHADFALRCKGDSMINARIYDGDIVYIRQHPTVNDGEIAAVLIDDEATLKRVRLFPDHIVLEPENPQYRPLVYWGDDMNTVRIIGKAVAFTSVIR